MENKDGNVHSQKQWNEFKIEKKKKSHNIELCLAFSSMNVFLVILLKKGKDLTCSFLQTV